MAHGEVNVQPPQNGTNTPAAERTYAVHRVDLPTYCPVPGSSLWNGHPRVYIPLKETGDEARCIYCGARFRLVD
ncbi:zinc-finger domain-containing protein [Candidatus Macondimonas diazotrophica]|uniref:Zinc-finger domain-containing protein n=1 Tax=Candidatus Macondimonas diazotrophica TaxID=2305248 RepID=A0A4Z0FDZ6_9GAMM|nr:zinc-finger domain-containing protein [Candidatus Macondimonas diazotrophica]NCU01584.1 zinc-finger domain-containing protein [Candidatus Macondimonas diazotrophica]TFZ84215.1 zinc-finger domain-containing protein [Candidatus Macondimonas diazotrophica]HBG51711.1 zinc-finger domain-containing protein [Gammaproteobacteria bacterium]